jgi:hypothetical protein
MLDKEKIKRKKSSLHIYEFMKNSEGNVIVAAITTDMGFKLSLIHIVNKMPSQWSQTETMDQILPGVQYSL